MRDRQTAVAALDLAPPKQLLPPSSYNAQKVRQLLERTFRRWWHFSAKGEEGAKAERPIYAWSTETSRRCLPKAAFFVVLLAVAVLLLRQSGRLLQLFRFFFSLLSHLLSSHFFFLFFSRNSDAGSL